MQIENIKQQVTFKRVIAEKIISYIQAHKTSQIVWNLTELCLGLFFGALAIEPIKVLNFISTALKTQDYAPPKFIGVVILFFYRKQIIKMFKKCVKLVRNLSISSKMEHVEKLIDNIPVSELVDYLIRTKKFLREGVNGVRATFGLNMERYNKLAENLEKNGVLVRGENNSRILDSKWSRQTLVDYLSVTNKSINLSPRFKIHRIGEGHKIRLDKNELVGA